MEATSFTGKRWRVRHDLRSSLPAARDAWTDAVLAHFLAQRELTPTDASTLAACGYPAAAFPDLPAAVERIRRAIGSGETVAVFGDYDCDGITSTALLARFFARRGIKPVLRLPHREREGYGLKSAIVRELHGRGVRLLITVDTGGTAVKEIAETRALGMDVIVADHHRLSPEIPDATAILHPTLSPNFPGAHPCAAGVAWTLVRALEAADGVSDWQESDTDLALAMIGTVADLVPLTGGNRSLAACGLAAFNRVRQGPLELLKIQSGLTAPASSRDIAFRIAPRVNAAGRMAEPDIALNALLGDSIAVTRLEELNRQRQDIVGTLTEDALSTIHSASPFLCLKSPAYLAGICGLIAGKLAEKFGRPSLVAHEQGELCVASLRSVPGYDVAAGLEGVADLLVSHGGHAMAAGCAFKTVDFPALAARLEQDVCTRIRQEDMVPLLHPDLHLDPQHLHLDLYERLARLEPFGQGNPEPSFLLTGVTLLDPRRVGREGTHLQGTIHGTKLVGFGLGAFANRLADPVDVVCRLGLDTWRGQRGLQLMVEDIRTHVPASVASPVSSVATQMGLGW